MRATNTSNVGGAALSLSPLSKGAGLIPGSYGLLSAAKHGAAVVFTLIQTAYRQVIGVESQVPA